MDLRPLVATKTLLWTLQLPPRLIDVTERPYAWFQRATVPYGFHSGEIQTTRTFFLGKSWSRNFAVPGCHPGNSNDLSTTALFEKRFV